MDNIRYVPDKCRYCERYGTACGRPHPMGDGKGTLGVSDAYAQWLFEVCALLMGMGVRPSQLDYAWRKDYVQAFTPDECAKRVILSAFGKEG